MMITPSTIAGQKLPPHHVLNLELWKVEISAANNAFIHGRYPQAATHYEAALTLASSSVNELLAAEDVTYLLKEAERQIAALVVTHHNLADLFRQTGYVDKTITHLCDAHETLFRLSHHCHAHIREMARRHLKITYRELITFIQRDGQHKRIQQSLVLTQPICDSCRQKTGH